MKVPVRISQPKTDYYPLNGGLDLVTPAIAVSPGKCLDAQNYMPEITGGYRRIYGYERFDGRPAPSSAKYWTMPINATGVLPAGGTIVGVTSGAYAAVLGLFAGVLGPVAAPAGASSFLFAGVLVMGRVSGTFTVGESITIAGAPVATVMEPMAVNGASSPSDDADYTLLAANDLRNDIGPVPGSGPVRGVVTFKDITYAFRDSADGTAGGIYRATAAGWVPVTLGNEIQFTAATGQINAGDLITGGTSGATAVVSNAILRTGTWTTAGQGTLIIAGAIGTFVSGEPLKVSGISNATSASANTGVGRLPGGWVDMTEATFNGSGDNRKIYGADSVNPAFEFDGSAYIPIHTGNTVDAPTHVAFHKNYLWLSFGSNLQNSGIGNPFSWDAIAGAADLAAGAAITGMRPQTGSNTGASMAVFTASSTPILYGSSPLDFQLVVSNFELGYFGFTMQSIGNDIYGLTARGIQALTTTQQYGDFLFGAVSFPIQPLMEKMRGQQTCSVTSQALSQYRLFFKDGTGVVVGLTGGKVSGLMPLNYGRAVRCANAKTLSTGTEVTFLGSDDGFVYQDNIGTSFDGAPIEAWIRLAFNNLSSPSLLKRFLRAIFDVKADGFAIASAAYDLGYANPDVNQAEVQPLTLIGEGGYWGSFIWDQFTWEAQVVAQASVSIDGAETNIAFLFYSERAQDRSHVVQGVNLHYLPRRLKRG